MPFFPSPSNSPMRWRLPWRKYLVLANFWISPYICAFDHGWKNQSDWRRPANVSRQGYWGKQKKHKNKVDNNKSLIYRRMKNARVAGPCTCCISLRKRASWPKHLESEPLPRGHSNEALDTQTALLVSYWHIAVFSGPMEILSQTCSSKESWIILQQPRPDFDVTAVSRPSLRGCAETLSPAPTTQASHLGPHRATVVSSSSHCFFHSRWHLLQFVPPAELEQLTVTFGDMCLENLAASQREPVLHPSLKLCMAGWSLCL